jgi:type I restriction enzyme, S subunit
LEGLEIGEILLSNLERTKRIDADFYSSKNQQIAKLLLDKKGQPITEFVSVSDGNHMTVSDNYSDNGIPYYRGSDIYYFFIEQATNSLRIEEAVYEHSNMKRSHLRKGDVLMSIVGAIIGNVSVVSTNNKATCSCKLAILRPKDIDPLFFATYLKSNVGQNQIQKFRRGGGQTGLILEDFNQFLIPKFTASFQESIAGCVSNAHQSIAQSETKYNASETLLLQTLGLIKLTPSTEAVNIKSFKDSFSSTGRLDAEYYQPKYEQMMAHITGQAHSTLGALVNIQKSVEPGSEAYSEDAVGLPFVRVADYSKLGLTLPQVRLSDTFVSENLDKLEALKPKQDTILFSKDGSVGEAYRLREDADFITSGAILHLTVRDKTRVLPDYLTLVLNSIVVKQQAERDAGGSIILHWRKEEIENVLVPVVDMSIQQKIATQIQESFKLRAESEHLIEVAKRAVEIAIEQDEQAGLEYIERETAK